MFQREKADVNGSQSIDQVLQDNYDIGKCHTIFCEEGGHQPTPPDPTLASSEIECHSFDSKFVYVIFKNAEVAPTQNLHGY